MGFYSPAGGQDKRLSCNYLASDVTITNSNVYIDVPNLAVDIEASKVYKVTIGLFASSATDADIDVQFTYPVGCTMTWAEIPKWDSVTAPEAITDSLVISGYGTTKLTADMIIGVITNGANAGTFQVQFRQHAARESNASIYAGSFITSIEAA